MSGTSVSTIAYYLALIGGIFMVLLGLLGFLVSFGGFFFRWGFFAYGGIVTIIMGVIAIIGARSASTLVWAIVFDNCRTHWRRIGRISGSSRWNIWPDYSVVKKSIKQVCLPLSIFLTL